MNTTALAYGNSYRVVIVVFMTGLLQGLTLVSFPSLSPVLKTTLSLSDTAYGAIFLPQVALTAAGAVAGGLLAKRLGLPALLRLSLLADGLSQLALLASVSTGGSYGYLLLIVGTSFLGLGFGLSAAPLNRYPILFFPDKPDSALTALHTFIGTGLAAGPFAVGMLVEMGSWQAFPAGLALLALFMLVLSLPLQFPLDNTEAADGAMVETRGLIHTPAPCEVSLNNSRLTSHEGIIICPACGGENPEDAVFCGNSECHKALGEFKYVLEELLVSKSWIERLADRVTLFVSRPHFIILHMAWFILWILANEGFIWGFQRFDEYPYSLLGIILAIEAILITGFLLISQHYQYDYSEKRAELDYEFTVRTYRKLIELEKRLELLNNEKPGED